MYIVLEAKDRISDPTAKLRSLSQKLASYVFLPTNSPTYASLPKQSTHNNTNIRLFLIGIIERVEYA